jgi:hypothetical protein
MMFHLRNFVLCVLVCSMLASVAEARGRRKGRVVAVPTTVNYYFQYPQPNDEKTPPPPPGYPPTPEPIGKPAQIPWSTSGGSFPAQTAPRSLKAVTAAEGGPVIHGVEPHAGGRNERLVRGDNFGTQAGQVTMEVNGVQIRLEATTWAPNAIIVKMPELHMASDAATYFTVLRTDGVANPPARLASQ